MTEMEVEMTNHTKHTLSDTEIIDLYWARDEEAIRQTDHKYRAYLLTIAENILNNMQDLQYILLVKKQVNQYY